MRTQKLPGLSKASGTLTFSLFFLHSDLDYGVSEAEKRDSLNICLVNYYLVYDISEMREGTCFSLVSYCLIYGTSKTRRPRERCPSGVNYYLNYGTSETCRELSKMGSG